MDVLSAAPRRFLLISYHFPPGVAVGALRWRKMLPYFAAVGYAADVITLQPENGASQEGSALAELPDETRVLQVPHRGSRALALARFAAKTRRRLLSAGAGSIGRTGQAEAATSATMAFGAGWRTRSEALASGLSARELRRMILFELGDRGWRKWQHDAARMALTLDSATYDFVVSSGPPHQAHVAAHAVSRKFGIPHVLDLRDPWQFEQRVTEGVGARRYYTHAARLERRCFAHAALIVSNTEKHAQLLRRVYPALAERIVTVQNGVDVEGSQGVDRANADAGDGALQSQPSSRPHVELRHVGSVYLDRDPSPLLRAMAAANSTESARFRLTFVGNVGQPERQHIETAAEQCGVQRDISYTGRLPRPEALRAQAEADVLVLLPQDSDMAIPAKLFEYSGAAAFVLVMAEPDSATAELLAGRDAYVVPPQDVEQLRAALVDIRRRLQAGERPRPLNHDGFFDRSRQAEVLLRHLRSAGLLTSAV